MRSVTSFLLFGGLLFANVLLAQQEAQDEYPKYKNIQEKEVKQRLFIFATINDLSGVIGTEEVMLTELSSASKISFDDFAEINELDESAGVQAGQAYYFEEKRKAAATPFHTLAKDQSIWEVSQKYAIQKKYIYKYNRLKEGETPKPGLVLWLQSKRPKKVAPEYREAPEKAPLYGMEEPTMDEKLQEMWKSEEVQANLPERVAEGEMTVTEEATTITESPDAEGSTLEEDLPFGSDTGLTDFPETDLETSNSSVKYKTYVVKPGEELSFIAMQEGVTVEQIRGWNTSLATGQPETGDVIIVGIEDGESSSNGFEEEVATQTEVQKPTHIVQEGEGLRTIAFNYGISQQQLAEWNNIAPGDFLEPGRELIVGQGDMGDLNTSLPVSSESGDDGFGDTDDGFDNVFGDDNSGLDVSADELGGDQTEFSSGGDSPFLTVGGEDSGGSSTDSTVPTMIFGQENNGTHYVDDGETLFRIASAYDVEIADLRRWNNISGNNIQVGDMLYVREDAVPAGTMTNNAATSAPAGMYEVKSGDTFYSIEEETGVTEDQMREWNDIEGGLQAGKLLYIQDPATIDPNAGQEKSLGTEGSEEVTTNPDLQKRGLFRPSTNPGKHVVQPQETTFYIAALYDIRHSELEAWNHLTSETLTQVRPGDVLIVSQEAFMDSPEAQAKAIANVEYHTVEKGETLFKISQRFGITLSQLREWNDKNTTDAVFVGEKLIVGQ
ncbi:MAG: LysM peptidoglycan-binding domain-containing protein [Bacteroidota bacterium]